MSDIIDINVGQTTEEVTINVVDNVIQVNINQVTGGGGAVSSVNNQTGDVVLNQDDILDGTTYKQFSLTEKNKLEGIEAGAEVNVNADWNATSGNAQILNKPNLATVATSGSYNDLINKPTIPDVSTLVPYTGATQDVDLGTNGLDTKFVKIKGTAGDGKVTLKHQSTNSTAGGQETALFAGNDGELYYKNDGNTLAQIASRAWVNAQGFITNIITALGYTPENVSNKQTDLTASSTKYPTVNAVNTGLATKEPIITAGTTSQYYRGDKTFQTLDKTAVGLSNVDNTSDANKPVSTAQATAIGLKEDSANKSTSTADSASSVKFPVWSAILSYFDASRIRTILGISTLSGSNTGDETQATIQSKLGLASTSTSGYLSSTDWNTFNNKGYTLGLGATSTTYAASATYYFGVPTQAASTASAQRKIYIPQSGTIKAAQIYVRTTNITTNENWTLSIRLNNSTNTSLATVGTATNDKVFATTSLNIAVVAGDYIEITTTTPAWVTAPGSSFIYGTIYIQ